MMARLLVSCVVALVLVGLCFGDHRRDDHHRGHDHHDERDRGHDRHDEHDQAVDHGFGRNRNGNHRKFRGRKGPSSGRPTGKPARPRWQHWVSQHWKPNNDSHGLKPHSKPMSPGHKRPTGKLHGMASSGKPHGPSGLMPKSTGQPHHGHHGTTKHIPSLNKGAHHKMKHHQHHKKSKKKAIIGLAVGGAIISIVLVSVTVHYCCNKNKRPGPRATKYAVQSASTINIISAMETEAAGAKLPAVDFASAPPLPVKVPLPPGATAYNVKPPTDNDPPPVYDDKHRTLSSLWENPPEYTEKLPAID